MWITSISLIPCKFAKNPSLSPYVIRHSPLSMMPLVYLNRPPASRTFSTTNSRASIHTITYPRTYGGGEEVREAMLEDAEQEDDQGDDDDGDEYDEDDSDSKEDDFDADKPTKRSISN